MASSSSSAPELEARESVPNSTMEPIEEWQPRAGSLREVASRGCDFARFTELQAELKRGCTALWQLTRRDFAAVAQAAPQHTHLCQELGRLDAGRFSPSKLVADLERLVRRMEESERLQIVFIGPVNAGKTTLINMLLMESDELLPTNLQAETWCIWRITSSDGSSVAVMVDGCEQWRSDYSCTQGGVVDVPDKLRELSEYLQWYLSREAMDNNQRELRREITIVIPLTLLNPFGCHYALADTPGYTESETYEALVSKYLHDHSHIICMVCSLSQGRAIVQATQNMLSKSYSRTFWALTNYDDCMTKCGRHQNPREAAEKAMGAFRKEIHGADAKARVFGHAAQVLAPQRQAMQGLSLFFQQHLPREEAAQWLEDIRLHVKDCFVEIQQRNHTLFSQSRHCVDRATDLLNEYLALKDSSSGRLTSLEYCFKELQSCAEVAADEMTREVRQEIETVKTERLESLCRTAAAAVRARSRQPFLSQRSYFEKLGKELAQKLQEELQSRFNEVEQRAHHRILETAQRLSGGVGMAGGGGPLDPLGQPVLNAPSGSHLKTSFPVESVMSISLAATSAGSALCYTLGLTATLGGPLVLVFVAASIIGIGAIGHVAKEATEKNPFWCYETVEADVRRKLEEGSQWNVLAEDVVGQARLQLLSFAQQHRYSFSVQLLHQGTPREVLDDLFPDLSLFERLREDINRVNGDIQEFTDCPDLAASAAAHLQQGRESARLEAWDQVADVTVIYAGPNARTDSIKGELLAGLLNLRCHALVMESSFRETRKTAEVFKRIFPGRLLPSLYYVAASLRCGVDSSTLAEEVDSCFEQLDGQHAEFDVPRELQVWFLAVAASFLRQEECLRRLRSTVECFVANQMKQRPSMQRLEDRLAAGTRLNDHVTQEIIREFDEECASFAIGVVNSVHLLLRRLPASHVNIGIVGVPLVQAILEDISRQLARPPAMDTAMEIHIRSALCPVDQGFVPGLSDEWVRVLGEALRGAPVQSRGSSVHGRE